MATSRNQTRVPYQPGNNRGNMKQPPTTSKPTTEPQGQKPPSSGNNPQSRPKSEG